MTFTYRCNNTLCKRKYDIEFRVPFVLCKCGGKCFRLYLPIPIHFKGKGFYKNDSK